MKLRLVNNCQNVKQEGGRNKYHITEVHILTFATTVTLAACSWSLRAVKASSTHFFQQTK